jgi:hypothetical protein
MAIASHAQHRADSTCAECGRPPGHRGSIEPTRGVDPPPQLRAGVDRLLCQLQRNVPGRRLAQDTAGSETRRTASEARGSTRTENRPASICDQ